MRRYLITVLMHVLIMAAHAADAPYYFSSLNIENGLSNNSVNVIMQDQRGMLWIGTKDGLNLYNGISCRTFRKENSTLGDNFITALYESKDGRVWIGTDAGIYIYQPMTERFELLQGTDQEGADLTSTVSVITSDPQGNVWVAYNGTGIFRYDAQKGGMVRRKFSHNGKELRANVSMFGFDNCDDNQRMWVASYEDNLYYTTKPEKGKCHPYRAADGSETFRGLELNCGLLDVHNCSYVGTNRGLYAVDHKTNIPRVVLDEYVRTLCLDGAGQVWVGTENGVFILNPVTGSVRHITATNSMDPYSLSDNAIYSIFKDREDGMWIGSYFGGVNYYSKQNSVFLKIYPNENTPHMGKRVREICPGLPGELWIGTEDRGLYVYSTQTGQVQPYSHPELYHNIHGLCHIGDEMWVGTFSGGLNRINLRTHQLRHYSQGQGPGRIPTPSVFCICHTSVGETLLGTIGGVYRYHAGDDTFEHTSELMGEFVYDIMEDHLGGIWYATYNNGLYYRDARNGHMKHFMPDEDNAQSIPSHKVTSLMEDSRYRVWISTQGGGCCSYDTRTQQFRRYNTATGLPSNVVMRTVEDQQGNIWMTTNHGLACMNPETEDIRLFSTANGLLSDQFNYQSGLVDADGTVYLGSIGGLVSFRPEQIRPGHVVPQLVVSDLYVFDDRAEIAGHDAPLKRSIMLTDTVTLNVDQNTFSLRAAVLSFPSPRMNQIIYMLEGYEQEWQTLLGTDLIRYPNLSYGTYHLHIRGRSYDGLETAERVITIRIKPPFYLTPWAYLMYVLLVCGVGYTLYKYMHAKTKQRHQDEIERLRTDSERELYGAKIEFFTNVAHEIRTPLTLIKSPLENVLHNADVTPGMRDDLEVMQLNTERLLDLVNELLDFRKTESKGFQMHFTQCDLVQLIRRMQTRFVPFARQQGLELTVDTPEQLVASVDREGFTKITSNLLTNAIKYSATYVHVILSDEDGNVVLRVENDGDIVPLEMREEIFKSFTRYTDGKSAQKSGSGVGLTLARSLAELHEGTLAMDNDLTCNRFVLQLPVMHDDTEVQESATADEHTDSPEAVTPAEHSAYTLLVVEDNEEMRTFVHRLLASRYRVVTAGDGRQALELLARETVHLIISDVMMPVMDGLELCNSVKMDLNYSHIPVILLTAKVGMQATIEGLQQGADAYIEKPFSTEHLLATIENLLRTREILRTTYRNSPLAQTNQVVVSKADEEFLGKLHNVILANMKDSDFSIDQMAQELAMSRSSLNRKIKALMDISPNDYVRIERLKYAAELLHEGRYKINEVCYMAGFNTPSYFAKCFQKQFGVLPNEYVRQ